MHKTTFSLKNENCSCIINLMPVRLELAVTPLLARGNYQVDFITRTANLPQM